MTATEGSAVGGGDFGTRYRTKSERDAKLFLAEQAERPKGPRRTRLEIGLIALVAALTLLGWGAWLVFG